MLYLKSNNNGNDIVTALPNVLYFHHMISTLFIEFYFMSDVPFCACISQQFGKIEVLVDSEFNFHRKVMVRRSYSSKQIKQARKITTENSIYA